MKWVALFVALLILPGRLNATSKVHGWWDLNDVSILVPFPIDATEASLLPSFTSVGQKGEIFPSEYYKFRYPSHLAPPDIQDEARGQYVMLGLRVDPCGLPSENQVGCSRQLRLIMQRISTNPANVFDFAHHLTFELTENEFARLLNDLYRFKLASPVPTEGKFLGVHPGLAAAGLKSSYFDMLKRLVLTYAGSENLLRFTFTNIDLGDPVGDFFWAFGRVDIGPHGPEFGPIAGVNATEQILFSKISDGGFSSPTVFADPMKIFPGTIPALSVSNNQIGALIGDLTALQSLHRQEVKAAMRASFKIENPKRRSLVDTDCASCHVATKSRRIAEVMRAEVFGNDGSSYRNSHYNLAINHDPTVEDFRHLRAFSYSTFRASPAGAIQTLPSIIPRTIFESAEVCDKLNRW